jgi:methanogenic corrinoid protein MtbC1
MLTQSNEAGAQQILDQAFAILAPEQIALEIIEPVMNELGARWQRNEMNVWQEHLASNLIRQRILSFMQSQPAPAPHALSLVAACAPEEQHELGLLLLALLMRRQGWRVTYLGQRTPLGDVLPLLKEHRVAISVSTSTGLTSLVPLLSNKTLRRDHLFFGGYLPNQLPRLREHLPGAFLGINAPEGVRALTTTEPKPNQWTQTNKALRVAMLLQQQRLKLGWQTVENSDFRVHGGQAEYITLQALTQPTLFFVDALISAIAFDVPELVDEQVRWLNKALPPRGVERQPLKEYIETFRRVAHQNLETDTTPQVSMLLDRFQEMFDSGKGDE